MSFRCLVVLLALCGAGALRKTLNDESVGISPRAAAFVLDDAEEQGEEDVEELDEEPEAYGAEDAEELDEELEPHGEDEGSFAQLEQLGGDDDAAQLAVSEPGQAARSVSRVCVKNGLAAVVRWHLRDVGSGPKSRLSLGIPTKRTNCRSIQTALPGATADDMIALGLDVKGGRSHDASHVVQFDPASQYEAHFKCTGTTGRWTCHPPTFKKWKYAEPGYSAVRVGNWMFAAARFHLHAVGRQGEVSASTKRIQWLQRVNLTLGSVPGIRAGDEVVVAVDVVGERKSSWEVGYPIKYVPGGPLLKLGCWGSSTANWCDPPLDFGVLKSPTFSQVCVLNNLGGASATFEATDVSQPELAGGLRTRVRSMRRGCSDIKDLIPGVAKGDRVLINLKVNKGRSEDLGDPIVYDPDSHRVARYNCWGATTAWWCYAPNGL